MSRESLVFILGIVVFFTPFLGVTNETKRMIAVVAGALLIYVGYKLRRAAYFRSIEHKNGERAGDMFVENHELETPEAPEHGSHL